MSIPSTPLTPPPTPIPGNIISASCNVQAAMMMIVDYLQSTYDLQAADTILEQSITNSEAQEVQAFEASLTAPGEGPNVFNPGSSNYIWQLENMPAGSNSNDITTITQLYTNANMQNQSLVKVMDANNSTAQNTLSQNSQGQQGLMQTMSAINQQQANLARDIQG